MYTTLHRPYLSCDMDTNGSAISNEELSNTMNVYFMRRNLQSFFVYHACEQVIFAPPKKKKIAKKIVSL